MKICIVAEGCYPYVRGGVSNWIQMLITKLPEHEFVIHTIAATKKSKGEFKYSLPKNIVGVYETFLDLGFNNKGKWGKNISISNEEKDTIKALLNGAYFDWNILFKLIIDERMQNITEFFMSKDFYDILKEVYQTNFFYTPYNDFFWTVRSMMIPLFYIIRKGITSADIYHSVSTGYAGILASLGKYIYKKPLILTEHGIYTREREEEIIKADWVKGYFKNIWIEYFKSLSRCTYNEADMVVTLFNKNKDIQTELGCQREKISIIPNGVDIEKYSNANMSIHPEDSDYFNIGAVVRIVGIKDIHTMIQGFALVNLQFPHTRLYIMGSEDDDPEYYEECKNIISSMKIKNIIFTGSVDILEFVPRMHILLLTSISEGQPLAVLEGMAFSKPYVTTNVGSCSELLYGASDLYGKAGIVVPVMDYKNLSKAIIWLITNEKKRTQMGINAYNRVSNLYTLEKFISAYRKIYESCGEKNWRE